MATFKICHHDNNLFLFLQWVSSALVQEAVIANNTKFSLRQYNLASFSL